MVTPTADELIYPVRTGFDRGATEHWESIAEPNEQLLSFLLFVLVAFVLLAVDAHLYVTFVGPALLA